MEGLAGLPAQIAAVDARVVEAALELGWVKNADEVQDWLHLQLAHGLAHVDLPLLFRIYAAVSAHPSRTGNTRSALAIGRPSARVPLLELRSHVRAPRRTVGARRGRVALTHELERQLHSMRRRDATPDASSA